MFTAMPSLQRRTFLNVLSASIFQYCLFPQWKLWIRWKLMLRCWETSLISVHSKNCCPVQTDWRSASMPCMEVRAAPLPRPSLRREAALCSVHHDALTRLFLRLSLALLPSFFNLNLLGVTLVNHIIWVSGMQPYQYIICILHCVSTT